MTVAETHDASTQGEAPSWAWPVHAFVAWLAAILGYVTRFKRIRQSHRFKPDWRDSWEDLRQSEWLRDQMIAQGVAQLLAGQSLHLDDKQIILTPPAAYGGPCPRTPFDMNRRFLALARWAVDPEAIIRERFRRLSRAPLLAHASTDATLCAAAQHELVGLAGLNINVALMLSRPQSGRPSTCRAEAQRRRKHERGLTKARGPPSLLEYRLPNAYCLESTSFRGRTLAP
jgi:hypothetical protein